MTRANIIGISPIKKASGSIGSLTTTNQRIAPKTANLRKAAIIKTVFDDLDGLRALVTKIRSSSKLPMTIADPAAMDRVIRGECHASETIIKDDAIKAAINLILFIT